MTDQALRDGVLIFLLCFLKIKLLILCSSMSTTNSALVLKHTLKLWLSCVLHAVFPLSPELELHGCLSSNCSCKGLFRSFRLCFELAAFQYNDKLVLCSPHHLFPSILPGNLQASRLGSSVTNLAGFFMYFQWVTGEKISC